MSLKSYKSGLKNSTRIRIEKSGSLKTVTRMRIFKDGGLKIVHPPSVPPPPPPPPTPPPPPPPPPTPLSVGVSSPYASGTRMNPINNMVPIFTTQVTATATGGSGTYTYVWTVVSWEGSRTPTAVAPNSATTGFRLDMMPLNGVINARFRVIAIDSVTGQQAQNYVDVEFYSYNSIDA